MFVWSILIVDIEWDFLVLSVEIDVKSMNGNGIYPEKCRSDSKPGAHMQRNAVYNIPKWNKNK